MNMRIVGFTRIITGALLAGALTVSGSVVASTSAVAVPDQAAVATVQTASAKLKSARPKIAGTAKTGKTLKVRTGSWTTGTKLSYRWYRNGKKVAKATKASYRLRSADVGKRIRVKVTGKKSGHKSVTRTSKATAVVKYPSRTGPVSLYHCPSWAPIKGNGNSGIYHLPGQRYYKVTQPEDCFRTEAAARKAGYRKAKV